MRAPLSIFFLTLVCIISSIYSTEQSQSAPSQTLHQLLGTIYGTKPKSTSSLLSNKKIKQLIFDEAACLYVAACNEKNARYTTESLERMYATCTDAKLAEMILWELANSYMRRANYQLALLAFEQFKQLFPGSVHYWSARTKEIEAVYCLCRPSAYDKTPAERVIALCRAYASETYDYTTKRYQKVLEYLQHAYALVILKEIAIVEHYLTRYRYTWNYGCILSCLLRLETISSLMEDASIYDYDAACIPPERVSFISLMESLHKKITELFDNHPVEIPHGKTYHETLPSTVQYITVHASALTREIRTWCCETKQILTSRCPCA